MLNYNNFSILFLQPVALKAQRSRRVIEGVVPKSVYDIYIFCCILLKLSPRPQLFAVGVFVLFCGILAHFLSSTNSQSFISLFRGNSRMTLT